MGDTEALKDRNYRMVELIRQVNAREEKRLDRDKQGLQTKCRYHVDQVSHQQKRIKRELVQVRTSTTTTWGFLPPRKGLNHTQPPDGLDQFQMEEFAKQLYDIKPKKKDGKNSSPQSTRKGVKTISCFNEADEYNGDLSDDEISPENTMHFSDRSPQKTPSKSLRRKSPQKSPFKSQRDTNPQRSPSKPLRVELHGHFNKAQNNVTSRLLKPTSLKNTPVNSPTHGRVKSLTARSARPADHQLQSLSAENVGYATWREDSSPRGTFRIQSLPPLDRVRRVQNETIAWSNVSTEKGQFPQSTNLTKPVIAVTAPNDEQVTSATKVQFQPSTGTPKSPNSQQVAPIPRATNVTHPKQYTKIDPKSKQDTTKKVDQKQTKSQQKLYPSTNPNDPIDEQPNARTLTPIRENTAIERQSTNASDKKRPLDLTGRRQSIAPAKKTKKKQETTEKKDDTEKSFDREKYNPDGSLRTIHTLPDFQESLDEALKARYLRNKYKPWYEREISVSECWSEQNLPWKKIAT